MRFLVRERVFGVGDDFWVEDEHGRRVFLVDGKKLRLRQTFQLKDENHEVVTVVRRRMVSLWPTMDVLHGRHGERLVTVRKKRFTLLRDRFRVRPADGGDMTVHGNVLDKEFDIERDGRRLARVSRKWFRIRDTYAVDIDEREPDADVPTLLSVAISVDALTERRE